jgi:hypothetical protein
MTRPHDYTPIIPGTEGWTDDMLPRKGHRLEDMTEVEEYPIAAPAPTQQSSLEERVDHLEKMHQLLWKAIHELKPKDE